MARYRFPLAVAATSLGLIAVLALAGGLLVGNALASSPFGGTAMFGGPAMFGRGGPPWTADHGNWVGTLPPELAGLTEVPAADRFAHFRGAQVALTDKDGKPLTLSAIAGTATSVSANSLTITANDGATRTFSLDAKTTIHSRRGGNSQAGQGAIADRRNEHLGRSDAMIILLRNIWQRELRALAEGQPRKQWRRPERLEASVGV